MYFKLAMFVQRTQSERGRKTRSFLLELGGVYCILNLRLVSDELTECTRGELSWDRAY